MRPVLTAIAIAALLAVAIWLRFRPSPRIRTTRIYTKEFREKIQPDNRFKRIEVVVFELGDKSPIGVRGKVEKESDLNELHQIFDSLHCPLTAEWYVKTNR